MLVLALPLLLTSASAQTSPEQIPTTPIAFQRLSAPPSTLGVEGDVQDFFIHPGGGAVLFRADTRWPGSFGLYHVPVEGGVPGVVFEPAQGRSVTSHAFDPGGQWVAFIADRERRGLFELYSHRVGTPGVRRLTFGSIPGAEVKSFAFSPGGGRIAFLADHEIDGKFELYTVPSDGSAPPRRLGGSLGSVSQYRFDASGSRIVFVDDGPTLDRIVSVTLAGSLTVHRSAPGLGDLRFTADGQSAFYLEPGPFGTELFRLELDGVATPLRMSPPASQSRQGVTRFVPTPDGNRVVFFTDLGEFGRRELWSADRNGLATQLAPAPDLGALVDLLVSPDSSSAVSWVDFSGVTTTVFAVPTDGSALPRVLARPNHFRSDQHQLSADSRYLVYRTGLRVGMPSEGALWSVGLDGTAPARRLDDPRGKAWPDYTPSEGSLTIDPGSTRVLYTWKAPEEVTPGLYSAPLDGTELQTMVRQRGASFDFDFSPDGERALFTASVGGVEVFELHSTRLSDLATTRLSADLAPGFVDDVQSFFQADPSGQHLVYASTAGGATSRLFRTRADGSEPAVALAATDARGLFTLSPDGARVVYSDTTGALCSVRADGTGAKLVLSATSVPSYSRFTPDSARFLYTDALGLRSVPSAGGSVLLLADEPASPLLVTPDSARVVFLVAPIGGTQQLLSVPVDGAGASQVLHAAGQLWVADPVLVASGTHVLFASYLYDPDRTSILCAPVDGSAPAVDLTASFHPFAVLPDFSNQTLVPDGQHFVYSALTDNGWGLFKRRIDGVGTPLLLFDGAESPFQFAFTPDATRVVFSSFVGEPRLWSAPLDGTTGAFELTSAATSSLTWLDPVLSPDGHFVLTLARVGSQDRLLFAPLDGTSVLRAIDGPPAGVNVREFLIAPDSASVVFRVEGAVPFQLYQRAFETDEPAHPVAGGGGTRALSLVRIEPDSSGLSLWGTRLIGVNELFRARLERAPFTPRLRRR